MDSADAPLDLHCLYGDGHRQLRGLGSGEWDASAVGDLLAVAPARVAHVHGSVHVRTAVCHEVALASPGRERGQRARHGPGVNMMTVKPTLLAGGNPQIAKGDGDVPVQAYIAAMPGWKRDVGRRLDALITR